MWASADFVPRSEAVGTPPDGRGSVAHLPTKGPLLILFPALKRWRPPRRHGLHSQFAHLWATSDFLPHSEVYGIPRRQGLCSQSAHLWASAPPPPKRPPDGGGYAANLLTCWPLLISSPTVKRTGPQMVDGRGYLANLPTCGPLLISSPTLKCWGSLDGRGYVANLPTCGPVLPPPPPRRPPDGGGYAANLLTCWPLLISSPTVKRTGPQMVDGRGYLAVGHF